MPRLKPLAVWSALALFFALAFSGCFLSNLQAWHTPDATIHDPALTGTWKAKNCSASSENKDKFCVMTLTPFEDAEYAPGKKELGYELAFRGENGVESTYKAFLFNAGGERFLESVVDTPPKLDPAFAVHAIPVRVLWRVRMAQGTLNLEPMRIRWANELARSGKLPAHVIVDKDYPVLDIPAKEAMAFLAEHAKDPRAFDDPKVWTKGAPPSAAAAPQKK